MEFAVTIQGQAFNLESSKRSITYSEQLAAQEGCSNSLLSKL